MDFIDLYCGAGFGARGAVAGGGVARLAVDIWQAATATYQCNFPEAHVITSSVDDVEPRRFDPALGADLLLTSPECTSHSLARGNRPADETSLETAISFMPWVDHFRPRWIVIENVARLRAWDRYASLCDQVARRGYEVSECLLNAADFGAPQARKRLFMICGRESSPPTVDALYPVHAPRRTARDIVDSDGTWRTTPLYSKRRAEATVERAERAIAELGRGVPFLIVYYTSDRAGGWQSLDQPLRTITTVDRFGLVTWDGNEPRLRMLQPPELLRAMGADRHLLDVGSRRDKVKLCGNGICSPVMQRIVECLRDIDNRVAREAA
ncbi:DNA -methyltransferase protein [Salinisphaera shabanensis E1L3A]|uniref:DNA (cytosine-5-)-methyltransferase n=1 Tax=Salinisphaera shabanensis E1L3A TaxID=1033802 RepID=U2E649_9GAMM|nr:DNA -methyltransferase protein [Salinisphaera shabanensis E1L3A]